MTCGRCNQLLVFVQVPCDPRSELDHWNCRCECAELFACTTPRGWVPTIRRDAMGGFYVRPVCESDVVEAAERLLGNAVR